MPKIYIIAAALVGGIVLGWLIKYWWTSRNAQKATAEAAELKVALDKVLKIQRVEKECEVQHAKIEKASGPDVVRTLDALRDRFLRNKLPEG